jgi:hypothetical protein
MPQFMAGHFDLFLGNSKFINSHKPFAHLLLGKLDFSGTGHAFTKAGQQRIQ